MSIELKKGMTFKSRCGCVYKIIDVDAEKSVVIKKCLQQDDIGTIKNGINFNDDFMFKLIPSFDEFKFQQIKQKLYEQ
jgi:hypothetical protein